MHLNDVFFLQADSGVGHVQQTFGQGSQFPVWDNEDLFFLERHEVIVVQLQSKELNIPFACVDVLQRALRGQHDNSDKGIVSTYWSNLVRNSLENLAGSAGVTYKHDAVSYR